MTFLQLTPGEIAQLPAAQRTQYYQEHYAWRMEEAKHGRCVGSPDPMMGWLDGVSAKPADDPARLFAQGLLSSPRMFENAVKSGYGSKECCYLILSGEVIDG